MIELLFAIVMGPPLERPAARTAPVEIVEPERVVVCRQVQVTGSRMPARRCASARTDETARETSDALLRGLLDANRTSVPQSGFYNPGSGKRGGASGAGGTR